MSVSPDYPKATGIETSANVSRLRRLQMYGIKWSVLAKAELFITGKKKQLYSFVENPIMLIWSQLMRVRCQTATRIRLVSRNSPEWLTPDTTIEWYLTENLTDSETVCFCSGLALMPFHFQPLIVLLHVYVNRQSKFLMRRCINSNNGAVLTVAIEIVWRWLNIQQHWRILKVLHCVFRWMEMTAKFWWNHELNPRRRWNKNMPLWRLLAIVNINATCRL